jgi:predicted Zn-dependent protease
VINLAFAIGAALLLVTVLSLLKVSLWLSVPLALVGGGALFVYLGRQVQKQLESIFGKASELLKKQQFDPAIDVMKKGYALGPKQFMVKGSIDGQIGVVQYLRKKNEEAEPLLRSASMNHYIAKSMLGILQWKRGDKAAARKTFDLALRSGKKESVLYGVYAYVLCEMKDRDRAIQVLNTGLKYCKGDERLQSNLTALQNGKSMKMKVFGEQWYQFMLERPILRQEPPPYARVSKRSMRG